MKPKNFPSRKLKRQLIAKHKTLDSIDEYAIEQAKEIRTKKDRSKQGKRNK